VQRAPRAPSCCPVCLRTDPPWASSLSPSSPRPRLLSALSLAPRHHHPRQARPPCTFALLAVRPRAPQQRARRPRGWPADPPPSLSSHAVFMFLLTQALVGVEVGLCELPFPRFESSRRARDRRADPRPRAPQTASWSLAYGYEKKHKAAKVLPGAKLDLMDAFAVGGTVTAAAVRPLSLPPSSSSLEPFRPSSSRIADSSDAPPRRASRRSCAASSSCTPSSTRASPRRSRRSGSRRPCSARSPSSSSRRSSRPPSSRRRARASSRRRASRPPSSRRSSSRPARTCGTASRPRSCRT